MSTFDKLTLGDFIEGHDAKTRLAELLGVGTTDSGSKRHEDWWQMTRCTSKDADGNLRVPNNIVMISLKEDMAQQIAASDFTPKQKFLLSVLRGWVVDIDEMKILCYSQGNTSIVVSSTIPESKAKDNIGMEYDFSGTNMGFYPGCDGVPIRVFLYKGKVYKVTHTSLDITNSRFDPKAPTFGELWEKNGPSNVDLYGEGYENRTSCISYYFLLCHPSLNMSSQYPMDERVLFVKMSKTDISEDEEFNLDFEKINKEKNIFTQNFMDRDGANNWLNLVKLDKYEAPCESVMVILPVTFEGITFEKCIRVAHPIYMWRKKILNDNPNIIHRAMEIRDVCNVKEKYTGIVDISKFSINSFPYLGTGTTKEYPLVTRPIEDLNDFNVTEDKDFRDLRFANAMLCLWLAAPPHKKEEVKKLYDEYFNIRSVVTNHIIEKLSEYLTVFIVNGMPISSQQLSKSYIFEKQPWSKNGKLTKASERIFDIVTRAYIVSKNKKSNNLNNLITKTITFNLKNENGSTLYATYKTITNKYFD